MISSTPESPICYNQNQNRPHKPSYLDYLNLDQDMTLENEFNKIVWTDSHLFRIEPYFINKFNKKPSFLQYSCKEDNLEKLLEFIKENLSDLKIVSYTYKSSYSLEESVVLISSKFESVLTLTSYSNAEEFELDDDNRHSINLTTCNLKFLHDMQKFFISLDDSSTKKNSVFIFEKDSSGGMHLVPHKIEGFPIDIDAHYNDDFKDIHSRLEEWCSESESINKKLVLLSGKPGTGKTNYLKNLIITQRERRIIYIPPYQVNAIADPSFFSFISSYKNSLLIVEDAERVLVSRDTSLENESVSLMLNLTDGILASALNFKVICTFNVDEDQIDKALTRKGRLFLKYRFDLLSQDKTEALYKKLYGTTPPEPTMTLASIYENDDNGHSMKTERKIGFGV